MIDRNKRIRVYFAWAFIALVVGIALLVVSFGCASYIEAMKAASPYIAIAGLAFLLASFILFLLRRKEVRKKEEAVERDARDVEEALLRLSYGESVNLDKNSYDSRMEVIKESVNDASMVRSRPIPAPSVLDEETFDDTVLRFLLEEPTSLASLTYFRLTCDKPYEEEGPLDALLAMLRTNYGEKAYFGEIEEGYAVFIPFAYSRAECVGMARRTVQLYSYSQGEAKIQTKASTAFYPDFAPRLITSEAIKGLASAIPMKVKILSAEMDRFGYPAAEEVNAQGALSALKEKIASATSPEQVYKAVKQTAAKALSFLGMDLMGLAEFEEEKKRYRIYEQGLPDKVSLSKVAKDGALPMGTLDPFYDLAKEEGGSFLAINPLYLPAKPRSILDSFSVSTAFFESVYDGERKLGLVYILAQGKADIDKAAYGLLREYSFVLGVALRKIHSLNEATKAETRTRSAYASFNGYGYAVDEDTMTLNYLSPNLEKAIPGARIGMKCHRAIYGTSTPCAKCPLKERIVEKSVPRLSSGTYTLVARPGYKETEVFVASRKEDFASSRIDELTGLYNDRALHEDLQKEILLKEAEGYILGVRIRNAPGLVRQFRLEEGDYGPILVPIAKALSAASLDGSLYRNGEYGFAYLLPGLGHEEAEELAEKVAKALRGRLPIGDKHFEPTLDFALMAYPLEAANPFDMDSLLRVLYGKADASSKGRIFENSLEQGRLADTFTYVETKLLEFIHSGSLPVNYALFRENAGKRIAYLETLPALTEEDGKKIPYQEANDLIAAEGKERVAIEAELMSLATMLGKKKKELQTSSVLGAILPIDQTCFEEVFVEAIVDAFRKKKASRSFLLLEVSENDVKAKKEEFLLLAEAASKKGIRFGLRDFDADMDEEDLKRFAYVRFPSSKVYGKHRDAFITALAPARNLGLSFLIDGVSSKEEAHYLGSLSLHYGRQAGEEPVTDGELIELLK